MLRADEVMNNLDSIGSSSLAEKFVSSQGYKKIGSGQFSTVYESVDSSHVIKIQKMKDLMWWSFAEYTQDNFNEHFPDIHQIVVTDPSKRLVAASMERLEMIPSSNWEKQPYRGMLEFLSFRGYNKLLVKMAIRPGNKKRARDFYDENFELANAIDEAADHIMDRGGVFDMHANNFMMRRNGQIVITDPGY